MPVWWPRPRVPKVEGGVATCCSGGAASRLYYMSANTKIAAGVAGGYLLGRTKKMRLAMMLAGALAGKRLSTQRQELLSQGQKLLSNSPQFKELRPVDRGSS